MTCKVVAWLPSVCECIGRQARKCGNSAVKQRLRGKNADDSAQPNCRRSMVYSPSRIRGIGKPQDSAPRSVASSSEGSVIPVVGAMAWLVSCPTAVASSSPSRRQRNSVRSRHAVFFLVAVRERHRGYAHSIERADRDPNLNDRMVLAQARRVPQLLPSTPLRRTAL
jgi:hypothetical protein